MFVDVLFLLAAAAIGLGLSLATYRIFAVQNEWPMGELHADKPLVPILIGVFCLIIGFLFAAARGPEFGGWWIILAGVLIFILLLGFGLIAFLALNQGPSELDLERTAIAQENATVEQQIIETETQNAIDMQETATANFEATQQSGTDIANTETQIAIDEAATETATAEAFAEVASATAAFEATQAEADALASATVIALTEGPGEDTEPTDEDAQPGDTTPSSQDNIFASATAVALTQQGDDGEATPTPEAPDGEATESAEATDDAGGIGGNVETEEPEPDETEDEMPPTPTGEGISLPAVQQTATALAQLFDATPTPEVGLTDQPTTIPGATPIPTTIPGDGLGGELPDTGLFDDVFQGNPAVIFLVAVGLLGVIAVTRGLRSANRKRDR